MILTAEEFRQQLLTHKRHSKKVTIDFGGATTIVKQTLLYKAIRNGGCKCAYCGAEATEVHLSKHYPHLRNHKKSTKNQHKVYPSLVFRAVKKDGTPVKLTADHVVPQARNGNNQAKNLQVLCYDCNQEKKDLMPSELILGEKWWYNPDYKFDKVETV